MYMLLWISDLYIVGLSLILIIAAFGRIELKFSFLSLKIIHFIYESHLNDPYQQTDFAHTWII